MRLPRLIRSTPFRLTLLFLALFAAAASAFLGYIYIATAGEVNRRADAEITREMESLEAAYRVGSVSFRAKRRTSAAGISEKLAVARATRSAGRGAMSTSSP